MKIENPCEKCGKETGFASEPLCYQCGFMKTLIGEERFEEI
jgi:ribosomal protein L37E